MATKPKVATPFSQWTPELLARCDQLDMPGANSAVVAAVLSKEFGLEIRPHTVRYRRDRRWREQRGETGGEPKGETTAEGPVRVAAAETLAEVLGVSRRFDFQPYWEKYREEVKRPKLPKLPIQRWLSYLREGERTILVLSDIHLPFQDEAMLQEAFRRWPKVDAIVLNGDITNHDATSRFVAYETEPPIWDIEEALRLAEEIQERYPGVPVFELEGNHPFRVSRRLHEHLDPALVEAVSDRFHTAMARPFPQHYAIEHWNFQIGNVTFAHGEKRVGFASARRAVEQFHDFFLKRAAAAGYPPPAAIVQGHVHQLGMHYRLGGVLIWAGTLSRTPGYANDPSMAYAEAQTNGCVVIRLTNGKFITNESRPYLLGEP